MEEEIKENPGQIEQPGPVSQPPPEMTEEELEAAREEINKLIGTSPMPETSYGVHAFLHNVATADDTTKVGYLTSEEVGMPRHPIRTLKELALFCGEVANMPYFQTYFNKKAEIMTSTSLSKDAKLINLAVVQRRESLQPEIVPRKENKGWFKKKKSRDIPEYS